MMENLQKSLESCERMVELMNTHGVGQYKGLCLVVIVQALHSLLKHAIEESE